MLLQIQFKPDSRTGPGTGEAGAREEAADERPQTRESAADGSRSPRGRAAAAERRPGRDDKPHSGRSERSRSEPRGSGDRSERPQGSAPPKRPYRKDDPSRARTRARTSGGKEGSGGYPERPGKDRPRGDRPAKPYGDRPAKPYGDRRPGGTDSERPRARRAAEDRPYSRPGERSPGRGAPGRTSGRAPDRRPPSDAGLPERSPRAGSDAPAGKKFDPNRPRDTRVSQARPEPKRRLAADETFGLPKPWIVEIQELSRPGTGPKVAELISKALEQFAEEDYEGAARLAAEAKASALRSPRISELLGLSLYHLGKWKEALSELLAFRRLTNSVEQNHVIADVYRALGRPDRALETTAEVSQGDVEPEVWVETMIVAAGALGDKGDFNRAITMLARADPGTGPVEPYFLRHWYARADLLERAGRREEARNLWRRIVAEDPEFFDAEERLASV